MLLPPLTVPPMFNTPLQISVPSLTVTPEVSVGVDEV
jgi:hypothetical protein